MIFMEEDIAKVLRQTVAVEEMVIMEAEQEEQMEEIPLRGTVMVIRIIPARTGILLGTYSIQIFPR